MPTCYITITWSTLTLINLAHLGLHTPLLSTSTSALLLCYADTPILQNTILESSLNHFTGRRQLVETSHN